MCGTVGRDLSSWSSNELCDAEAAIDGTLVLLFKARGTVRPTAGEEAKLAKEMAAAWKDGARKGMKGPMSALMARKVTPTRIKTFLRSLGIGLAKPLTAAQQKIITSRLESIWKIAKRIAAREAKTTFSFALVDEGAVAALGRQQVFWVGDFYSTHLADRIQGVANDVLIQQGIPQQEAGRVLQDALSREFGLKKGGKTAFAPQVPARYAANPDLYFRQVASTAAHQARSYSKVVAFNEAGFISYELTNPNDERTGQICQQMSGQVFTVRAAVRQMDAMLAAKSPDDIKAVAPWLSGPVLETALDGAKAGTPEATRNLQAAGASVLPPFHPLCRTEPVIIT